jgi:hypothetical protein
MLNPVAPAVVWTGSSVIVVGSAMGGESGARLPVAALDLESSTWSALDGTSLSARSGASAVWTGDVLLIWGGAYSGGYTSVPYPDGGRYRPDPPPAAGSSADAPPSEPEPGDVAVWEADPGAPPSPDATSFTARVTRLGCNSGVTGTVLRPGVVVTDEEVVVTFTVEADPDGGFCPSNDWVDVEVDVGQPIGTRTLVDGACTDGSRAGSTTSCENDGRRWPLEPAGPATTTVTGRMVMIGGDPGVPDAPAPGTVTALDPDGDLVDRADTDADGRFELRLPDGTYQLTGRSGMFHSGAVECRAGAEVVLSGGRVDGVEVVCSVR